MVCERLHKNLWGATGSGAAASTVVKLKLWRSVHTMPLNSWSRRWIMMLNIVQYDWQRFSAVLSQASSHSTGKKYASFLKNHISKPPSAHLTTGIWTREKEKVADNSNRLEKGLEVSWQREYSKLGKKSTELGLRRSSIDNTFALSLYNYSRQRRPEACRWYIVKWDVQSLQLQLWLSLNPGKSNKHIFSRAE